MIGRSKIRWLIAIVAALIIICAIACLSEKNTTLKAMLKTRLGIAALEQEAAQLKLQAEASAKTLTETKAQIASSNKELNALKSQSTENREVADKALNKANEQLASLDKKLAEAHAQIASLDKDLNAFKSESAENMAVADKALAKANGQLASLDKNLIEANAQIESLVNDLNALKGQSAETLAAVDKALAKANVPVASLDSDPHALGRQLSEVIAGLKAALDPMKIYLEREQFYGRAPIPSQDGFRFLALETSTAPDPAKNDYPDCLRTIKARVIAKPPAFDIPQVGAELVTVVWAFRDHSATPESKITQGDQFIGRPFELERLGKEVQEIQRADTLQQLSGLLCFLGQARRLPAFGVIHATPPAGEPLSREALLAEVAKNIGAESARHGSNWQNWVAEVAPLQLRVRGGLRSRLPQFPYHWDEYRESMGCKLEVLKEGFGGKTLSNVEQLRLFANEFERRGISFIYVPVPSKSAAWPELFFEKKFLPADGIIAPQWRKYIADLVRAGVEVVDLEPLFRAYASTDGSRELYLYEHHWAPVGIEIAAKETARHLRRFVQSPPVPYVRARGTLEYSMKDNPYHIGPRWGEENKLRSVDGFSVWCETPDSLQPFVADSSAPIMVFGDSNNWWVFRGTLESIHHQNNLPFGKPLAGGDGGFPAQLAFELQAPVATGGALSAFERGGLDAIPAKTFSKKRAVVYVELIVRSDVSNWAANNVNASAFEE
jgi:hypothetical protein